MKKTMKRILTLILVVCCVFSLMPEAFFASAAENYIFEDRFSGTSLAGWRDTAVGKISNGTYSISGDGANLATIPVSETLYSVQSKVNLIKKAGSGNSTASIVVGSDGNNVEYYEFGIGVAGNVTYAFLYKHCKEEEQSKTIYQITSAVPGTEDGRILQKTDYNLTAIVDNGALLCFINGEQFTTYQNANISGQYAGVKSVSANATFDDFIIQKENARQVAAIEVLNAPQEVTVSGVGLQFDIKVTYSGAYGVETISSDTEGVSIKGFDGKTGNKKITVSYGGASAFFHANVVKDTAPTVLFQDDFGKGIDTEKYTISALDASNGYKFEYALKGISGKAVATFPKNIGTYTKSVGTSIRVNNSELGEMSSKNYKVEADVKIVSNTTVKGGTAAYAGLEIASSGGSTYSFRINSDGTAQLVKKTTTIAINNISGFKFGKKFQMKAEVYDGSIYCYYNDKCVLVYQDESVSEKTRNVYVGLKACNGTMQFDNLMVTEIQNRSVWAANDLTVDDLQTKESNITTLKAYAIEPTRYIIKLHYADGIVLPVMFKQSMLSGYSSEIKKDQKITLNYGPFAKTLYYDYTDYIYFESLQNGQSDYWSGGQASGITTTFKDGLQISCISDTVSHEIQKYIEKFADVPDIKVSADVSMKPTSNSKERKIGVRARWTTAGDYYEYVLCYDSGDMFLQLRRIADDGKTELARYGAATVAELIGAEDLYMGMQYTLSIECAGNLIFLYINGHLLDVYWDNSEYAILSGERAGYRAVNTSGSVANFRVEKAANRKIKSTEIAEIDGTLKLYQGFEISPYDYNINVIFSDGLVYHLPINASMIAEYDNITPGVRTVPIACLGMKVNLQIEIVERADFIEEFADKVKDCKKAKKLTLDDKEYIDDLKKTYNSLSGYEVGTIDEKVIKKYQQVVDALYRLEHPELKKADTVYVNDFNSTIEETEWSSKAGDSSGSWRTFNSILVNEHERYGFSNRISYLENTDFYGEINSIEADVMLTSQDECYVALLSCIGEEGYYHARIRYYPQTTNGSKFTVQLIKNVSSNKTLVEVDPSIKGIDLELNTWYNLLMTCIDGKIAIYLNGVEMIQYDDSVSDNCFTKGTFGFRANYGDMRYDSLRVMGTRLESEEYVPQIEPTYYKDDFEDETQGSNPSHWIEETDSDAWKVYKKADSLVYGTKTKEYTYTWLHTFESDPEVSMDFMVENAANDGRIEFLTRYTQEKYAYAGIGYDFSQSKWYVYTSRGMDFEPQTVYAEQTSKLTAGTWHTIKIEEDDIHIKVYVDDELVIEDKNAYTTSYGRVGVLSEKTNLYIDNFSYTMPHGGAVSDGVIEYAFDWDEFGTMSCMEIESLGGNTLIGLYSNKKFISYDMGMTWERITGEYSDVMGKGSYQNLMRVSEGVYLMVYCDDFTVYKSTDYMKTWTKIGQIVSDLDGNSIGMSHLNTMRKLTLKDGTERIFFPIAVRRQSESGSTNGHYTRVFYSDDGGATWKESENDTRDVVPAYTEDTSVFLSWTESKITIDSEGVLRLFNSRNYGCVVYTESYDGGVTWEGFYTLPYLQNGQTSHTIAQDPENPNTYYMVCINDKTKFVNDTLPRTRHTLVKSTDGGKTWEFVMDLERFKEYENYQSSALYQMLDPSIVIVDGYIIISFGRAYAYDATSAHNKLALRFLRLEMDKLPQTTEWNDATLADSTRPETLEIDTMPQTIFGLGDIFTIYGGSVKLTAFNGNVTYKDLDEFTVVSEEPNMYDKGTYTVQVMNLYGQMLSFDVEVTDNYNITWNIQGEGEVTPYHAKIAKGLERTFTAKPAEGWKVKDVLVNGKSIALKEDSFSITGSEDITIDVIFEERIGENMIWIVTIAATVAIGGVIVIYVLKKKGLLSKLRKKKGEV